MMAVAAAAMPGLFMATARISNPVLSPEVFNAWYNDIHMRDMMENFSTVGLRYVNHTVGEAPADPAEFSAASLYLNLYNVPDVNFLSAPGAIGRLPLASNMLPDETKPVTTWSTWNFLYWLPVEVFDKNSTNDERPAFLIAEQVAPGENVEELENWYREEHVSELSTRPAYHRSTWYKSPNAVRPQYLALHEVDDLDSFMAAGDLLVTDRAMRIVEGAASFDTTTWQLFLSRGDAEQLGANT